MICLLGTCQTWYNTVGAQGLQQGPHGPFTTAGLSHSYSGSLGKLGADEWWVEFPELFRFLSTLPDGPSPWVLPWEI